VAGQDAVINTAPIERETHMRAAIVEREDMPALVHEKDRAMAAVHNEPALGFQLLKITGADEIRSFGIHGWLIRQVHGNAFDLSIQPPMYLFA
jgi:hypothetical protein